MISISKFQKNKNFGKERNVENIKLNYKALYIHGWQHVYFKMNN